MSETQASGVEVKTEPVKDITLQTLLACGAHYGHATQVWCPKMAPYIYGTKSVRDKKFRNTKDVYIFNLDLTLQFWAEAQAAITKNAAEGGSLLFVGTKPQGRIILEREALRSESNYVCHKWVGGILTNFGTLRQSIDKMDRIEKLLSASEDPDNRISLIKKEALMKQRDLDKLLNKFGGIRSMKRTPDMMFVVDIARNATAVKEAKALDIPVVGIADSNADPDTLDYIIPANDDATGALNLIISNVASAVLAGKELYQERLLVNSEGAELTVPEGVGPSNGIQPSAPTSDIPVTTKVSKS